MKWRNMSIDVTTGVFDGKLIGRFTGLDGDQRATLVAWLDGQSRVIHTRMGRDKSLVVSTEDTRAFTPEEFRQFLLAALSWSGVFGRAKE